MPDNLIKYINPLEPHVLLKVIEKRPDDSKYGFKQGYLQPSLAPIVDYGERKILIEMTYSENNIAGLYAEDGQALPVGDLEFSTMMLSLQDIKSTRYISPSIVAKMRDAGELAVHNAGDTDVSKRNRAAIDREAKKKIFACDDDVDSTLEYLAVSALVGTINWPPKDNDGNAIASPPSHWNAEYTGSWVYPIPSERNQDVTALVDYEGNAATDAQRKVWSDATADILGVLRIYNQISVENYGINLKGGKIVMADTVLEYMCQNTAILNWITGANHEQAGTRTYIDNDSLKTFVKSKTGWEIETYDAFFTYQIQVKDDKPTLGRVRYLPKNKILFIPAFGANLTTGTAPVEKEDASWGAGKQAWSYRAPKSPHTREVGVNGIFWPVYEDNIDHAVLKVL